MACLWDLCNINNTMAACLKPVGRKSMRLPVWQHRRRQLPAQVYTCDSSGPTFRLAKTGCYIDTSAIFRLLVRLRGGGAMIAASSGKSRLALDPQSGIRPGHAYAVISVIAAHGCRLDALTQ